MPFVVLKTAKLEGDRLTFDVDVLEGDLAGGDGPAALFIDRFGFGGFHAGGFRAGGMGGFHAARDFHGGFIARVGGVGAAGVGVVPTSLAAPGIAEATVQQRSVPPRWVGLRSGAAAASAYPYHGGAAAIIPIRPATEDRAGPRYAERVKIGTNLEGPP